MRTYFILGSVVFQLVVLFLAQRVAADAVIGAANGSIATTTRLCGSGPGCGCGHADHADFTVAALGGEGTPGGAQAHSDACEV